MKKIRMNKKKLIVIISIIAIIIVTTVICILTARANVNKKMTKAKGETIEAKFENVLRRHDFTFDVYPNVGTNYGASSKAEYALNDGTVFEVYTFVEKSVVFKDILKTGYLYVLGTETKYQVDTIKSMNIAIRYLNEGDRIDEVKEMLK